MTPNQHRITSIRFSNYKAFKEYSVSFQEFNVLVGPNNAGKSTVLGAIRILAEGIRKARTRNPEILTRLSGNPIGYTIDVRGLPVSTENVFHDYNEREPASITFRISNGNHLSLHFPERGSCYLTTDAKKSVRSTTDFKREFPIIIAFVPVLGPVEHNEGLNQAETARKALLSHNASRNFRNTWYHFKEEFSTFREMIQATWPGMDIEFPELSYDEDKPVLHMFCPEKRFPRELYWAGFGFQVWCQLLTFILRAKASNLLVIDEPDIYLHADLQRQLVSILQEIGPNIILATHSTEIISEVEPDSILNINKRFRSAKRVQSTHELQSVFSILGSNLNPTLTQLAKTKRVVFVEGKDFQIFARFARRLGITSVANRAHFAVIPAGGFNPQKVKDFSAGMELTLGMKLTKVVIFDRDYRCSEEVESITRELNKTCWHAEVHNRKEIENFLLNPHALARAIKKKADERGILIDESLHHTEIATTLMELTQGLKNKIQSQLVTSRQNYERKSGSHLHASTVSEVAMNEFDEHWNNFYQRMKLVSGKEVLTIVNKHLQSKGYPAITPFTIIDAMKREEIAPEMIALLSKIDDCRKAIDGDDD